MTDFVKQFMNDFMQRIEGAEIYLVGGAVRDFILGKEVNDYDFTTNISVDEIEKHFTCADIGQSKDFGIVAVIYEGEVFEVAQYRLDISCDGRHPEEVSFDATLEDDLMRRDFTINAMAMDVDGNIIDPYNGLADIQMGALRCVGRASRRFDEDALRILRAIRFESTLEGFCMEFDTAFQINIQKDLIKNLSQERITGEILKVASKGGKAFYTWLKRLEDFDLMPIIFPEIEKMKEYKHYWLHHPEGATMRSVEDGVIEPLVIEQMEDGSHVLERCGTVYDHVFSVMSKLDADASQELVMSALYHDIGKPISAKWKDDGTGTQSFKGHEHSGVAVFKEVAKDKKLGGDIIKCIEFCIEEHMNMNNHDLAKKSTILKMALNPYFDVLVGVSRADDESRNVEGNEIYVEEEFDKNLQKFLDARDNYVDTSTLKAKIAEFVDGKKVMEICNIKPSKQVGDVIAVVTEFLTDCDFDTTVEVVEELISSTFEALD